MSGLRDVTSADLALFGSIVEKLTRLEPERDPRPEILSDTVRLLKAEFGASYRWNPENGRYCRVVSHNMEATNLRRYEDWFQFRDPMTESLRRLRRASHVEEVIGRGDLERTEFFNDFLACDGLDHGVNVYLIDAGRHLGDLRIWRTRAQPEFGSREIALLDGLAPFLESAFKRNAHACDSLTARETDVARLVSRGCTDRDIARMLGISFGTVRTHLSRTLAKKGCANRAELAALFSRGGG